MAKILDILKNNSLLDLSGNGHNGTLTAGVSKGFQKAGLGQGGLQFVTSSYLNLSTFTSPTVFQSLFTIGVSAYQYEPTADGSRIMTKRDSDEDGDGFTLILGDSATPNDIYFRIDGINPVSKTTTIPKRQWGRIVVRMNTATQAEIFFNGVSLGTGTTSNISNITATGAVRIGNTVTGTTSYFNGLLQNVNIWNTCLTDAEIAKDYSEFQMAKQVGNISRTVSNFFYPDPTSISESGLLGAWSMNKVGGVVTDISNGGLNGTVTGATLTKGIKGNALAFNGSSNWVNCGTSSTLKPTEAITVSCWIKANVTSGDYDMILGNTNDDTLTVGYYMFLNANVIKFGINDFNANIATKAFTDTTGWHQIVGTYDKSNIRIYVDGVAGTPDTYSASIDYTGASGFGIGTTNFTNNAYKLNGNIDEVRVYNYAKTAAQVLEDYNKVARQVTIEENFSDEGADGIVKTPANWQTTTGTSKIGEYGKIASGDLLSGWTLASGWTSQGGFSSSTSNSFTTTANGGLSKVLVTVGRRYRISVVGSTTATSFSIRNTGGSVYSSDYSSSFSFVQEFTALETNIYLRNAGVGTTTITSMTLYEIPPIGITESTKYLEHVTAGVNSMTMQNASAYGTWEWDMYVVLASATAFVLVRDLPAGDNYYYLDVSAAGALRLIKVGGTQIMATANGTVANNTWYRFKITRTTAGVITVYMNGTAVTATSGSNPVTDTALTSSSYMNFSAAGAGSRIANIKKFFGVI